MIQTAETLDTYFARQQPLIEDALARCIDLPECPHALKAAMRHSLLAPGKRLRPLLVLMAAEACGGEASAAMPAACAVELVHTYSLIHDDLPAMDDDDLRRGRPACHKAFGEALAILAGDGLLARAFELLAKEIEPPAAAAQAVAILAEAAGPARLVGGQADDLEPPDVADRLALLESIHVRKTGALIRASLELGAVAVQGTPQQRAALGEYGIRLGLLFQITDDLLDVRGEQQAMGKHVGKDAQQGKLTYPGLLGIEASVERARQLACEAEQQLAAFDSSADHLRNLVRYVLERDR